MTTGTTESHGGHHVVSATEAHHIYSCGAPPWHLPPFLYFYIGHLPPFVVSTIFESFSSHFLVVVQCSRLGETRIYCRAAILHNNGEDRRIDVYRTGEEKKVSFKISKM